MRRPNDAARRASEWPRRRFLAAGASAAGLLAAGARWTPRPRAAEGPGNAPAVLRPGADLPIQGSPYLLCSDPSAARPGISPEARLVHFHLPPEMRDRLLLGIP